ncbi:hypothetical protein G3T14_22570 [Methylobacterium sp. BTF04]|uniref:hypothetical protein n=1 Tax=Methylobacterium sp. BTF04 TaxID=2708300 RepID=UPI0013D6E39E|nr:hypothetical protein [Methylobacterium sp. BTF04]NEU14850.1 hypothetical protein [Methylobacterium sp. BTF04]
MLSILRYPQSKIWIRRAQERPFLMRQYCSSQIRSAALALGFVLLPYTAFAQADMSCADYLKADAQMQAGMSPADKAAMQSDPQAADLDNKVRTFCKANPKVPTSEAMSKAMQ